MTVQSETRDASTCWSARLPPSLLVRELATSPKLKSTHCVNGVTSHVCATTENRFRDIEAIRATQERLRCEGYFEGRANPTRGALDYVTHDALAEFERRHRVYGWGFLGRSTVEMLRHGTRDVEREAVLRVLTERAMHAAGVIEDGSRSFVREDEPRTFRGADGEQHPIPNLEAQLRDEVIEAFGLTDAEATRAWLDSLGDLDPGEPKLVAIAMPELPEYYAEAMDLSVVIDRGDIWYEFPYDAEGNERAQPLSRRPRTTIFTRYNGQRIPLARFGTTVGGWRSEVVDGVSMWKYKDVRDRRARVGAHRRCARLAPARKHAGP